MVVHFKTPRKKQKVIPPEPPLGFDYGLSAGFDSKRIGLMTMTMSPGYLLEWSRYIVEECDTRNSRTIQSGELLILPFFRYIFLLKLVLDDPLFCRFVSVTFVVIGFSELARKVDDRLGKRRTRKYSSRNVFHKRMLGLHPEFPSFVAGPKHGLGTNFFR